MQYEDVFAHVLSAFPDAAVVSTCGHITRDLYNHADRPGNFYLVGSMGMAAPIAAGIAAVLPEELVVVFDGDGSLSMNTGGMLSVAAVGGKVVHVVLDNGQHGSTGGQRTVEFQNPSAAALAFGYASSHLADASFRWGGIDAFPALVHVIVDPRDRPVGKRVDHSPQEIRDRFKSFLTGHH